MTFTVWNAGLLGQYIKKNGTPMHIEEVVDLLNKQHEQINTLRESRRELISANNEYRMRETELAQELSTLVDENEQLKQDNAHLKVLLHSLQNEYIGLLKLVHGFDKND